MNLQAQSSTVQSFSHAFINKKGEAILIASLDERTQPRLVDMYLAYQPRNSFQGLPPITDEACVKWVEGMIRDAINLVALSFENGLVGHLALFPAGERECELLVVVSSHYQNVGIGTELTRCGIRLSRSMGFEAVRLTVGANNYKAKHIYRKCGFEYLSRTQIDEADMVLDLKAHHSTFNAGVAVVMNRDFVTIRPDAPCRTAIRMLLDNRTNSLPVVADGGELIGIITETDLIFPTKIDMKVNDILTKEVTTVTEEATLAKVILMFRSKKVRCIPVVDDDEKLLGIVRREDILAYYDRHL